MLIFDHLFCLIGIDRERLESFDRPIKVEPQDYPDKRGQLISDFRNYLGILKAVHSGADLNASAEAAGRNLPGSAKGSLGYVLSHQSDHVILPLIENAVAARAEIASSLPGNRYTLTHMTIIIITTVLYFGEVWYNLVKWHLFKGGSS